MLRESDNRMVSFKIHLIGTPGGENRENEGKTLGEIMANNSLELVECHEFSD